MMPDSEAIRKILAFLNPEEGEMENVRKMLEDLFGGPIFKESDLVAVRKQLEELPDLLGAMWELLGTHEACVAAFGDSMEDAEGFCASLEAVAVAQPRLSGAKPEELAVETVTEERRLIDRAILLLQKERRRSGTPGKHPLSGFAGGPSPKEHGTQYPSLVAKEAISKVEKEIETAHIQGRTSLQLTDFVHVTLSRDGTFGRVVYTGPQCPPYFSREGPGGHAVAEAYRGGQQDVLDQVVALATIAKEYENQQGAVVVKGMSYRERQKHHPLAGFRQCTGTGYDVLT